MTKRHQKEEEVDPLLKWHRERAKLIKRDLEACLQVMYNPDMGEIDTMMPWTLGLIAGTLALPEGHPLEGR